MRTRIELLLVMLVAALVFDVCSAHAQFHGRDTLLQWNNGSTPPSGGSKRSEPLATDRPDFTETSSVVGYGVVQLETGYTYTFDSDAAGSTREQTFPEALLRVGMLAEWFELRVGWTFANVREHEFGVASDTASGSEDLYLAFKLALTPQEGMLPEMALVPQMTVPSGSSELTADDVLPGVNFVYSWEINDRLSTAGQTQFNRALDDVTTEPYVEFSQSWTVGFSIVEGIGGYLEWFMFAPDGADTNHTEHYADGGFTFLISDNVQLDVRAGIGLNSAADDYFVGTGLSMRM